MSESFVQSFTHLKDRPKSDRALPMLQRIASLVKPIMRRHGWTLPVLAEFFPESPNLLGEQTASMFFLPWLIAPFGRSQYATFSSSTHVHWPLWFWDINQGYKICLRLRPAHAPDTFLDEEDIVQTMLHEVRGFLIISLILTLAISSFSLLIMYTVHMTKNSMLFCPNFKTNMMTSNAQVMLEKASSLKDID